MKTVAIIPSAGMGRRMGNRKKPFLPLAGRPVLAHTVLLFETSSLIDAIILVVPDDDKETCRLEIVDAFGFRKVLDVVPGGRERQDSVRAALDALSGSWDILVVHDGVRPFATVDLIEEVVRTAEATGAAIAAVPVKDTVKEVANGTVIRTVPREALWSVQTPQAFKSGILREAHKKAGEDGFGGTDDAALVDSGRLVAFASCHAGKVDRGRKRTHVTEGPVVGIYPCGRVCYLDDLVMGGTASLVECEVPDRES